MGVLLHHGRAGSRVHFGDAVFYRRTVHSGADDVEPGQAAGLGGVDVRLLEGLEILVAGAAGIDRGRDAARQGVVIGLEIQVRPAGVEVRVEIDEAGRDVVIAGLDDLPGVGSGDVSRDAGDFVTGDSDIEAAVAVVFDVDDVAVLEQQVVDRIGLRENGRRPGEAGQKSAA